MKQFFLLCCCVCMLPGTASADFLLRGTIVNPTSDSITIKVFEDLLLYRENSFSVMPDSNGAFLLNVPLTTQTKRAPFHHIKLQYGKYEGELFVRNGERLQLSANGKHFDSTVQYQGASMQGENFLAKHKLSAGTTFEAEKQLVQKSITDPAQYAGAMYHKRSVEKAITEEQGNALASPFMGYWRRYQQYNEYAQMILYAELMDRYRNNDKVQIRELPLSKMLPEQFNDAFLDMQPYRKYVSGLYDAWFAEHGSMDKSKPVNIYRRDDSVMAMAVKQMQPATLEYFMAERIYRHIGKYPLQRVSEEYKTFREKYPESSYNDILDKRLDIRRRLVKGIKADDVMSLSNTDIASIKNKVVFIYYSNKDCIACINDMNHLSKIEAYFKNKPVVFIHRTIEEKEQNTALEKLDAATYPAIFLVDKKGKLAADVLPGIADTDAWIKLINETL